MVRALAVACVSAAVLTGCGGETATDAPTGTILASARLTDYQSALFLVDADDGVRRLTPPSLPRVADYAVSPDGQIAFAAVGESDGERGSSIWLVSLAGELKRLGRGTQPAWSHRGDLAHLDYEENGASVVVRPRGAGRPVVLRVGEALLGTPQLSPSGATVAVDVSTEADDGGRIHLVDVRTGDQRAISTRAWSESGPAWSADGDFLALLSVVDADTVVPDLVVARPDGTRRRTISRDVVGFAWDRRGRRLVYATEDGEVFVLDHPGGRARSLGPIGWGTLSPTNDALLTSDGEATTVTPLGKGRPTRIANAAKPAWLPDGRVLFVRAGGLYVTRVGAEAPTQLVRPFTYLDASWSPDGRLLAYVRADPGDGERVGGDVVVADVDGQDTRRVATGRRPSWSPDGSRLAFEHDGDIQLVVIGGATAGLTSGPALDRHPVWSAHGDMIAFTRSIETREQKTVASAACIVVVSTKAVSCSNDLRAREPPLIEDSPTWSPTDDVVAYASYSNEAKGYYVFAEVCFLEGSAARKRGCVQGDEHSTPRWSGDGEALAVVGPVDGGIQIATRAGRLVSGVPGSGYDVAWAPKGRTLATGGEALTLVGAGRGAKPKRLVAGRVDNPAWSPDANWIAYGSGEQIAALAAHGGDARTIAELPGKVEYLLWRPG